MNYVEYQSLWRGVVRVPVQPVALRPSVLETIAEEVYLNTGVTLAEMQSPTRVRRVARARQEAMWRLRQLTCPMGLPRYSYPEIGRAFKRDHTTAIFACRAHEERVSGVAHAMLVKRRALLLHREKSPEHAEDPQGFGNRPQYDHAEQVHHSSMENQLEHA